MSFAHHKRGRPLFSQADVVSARERALLAENRQLRERNKRLKSAMLTLVERIEKQLPNPQDQSTGFKRTTSNASAHDKARENTYRERSRRYRSTPPPPKMEVYETFHEPIEFGEPAPEMRFEMKKPRKAERTTTRPEPDDKAESSDFFISPDLAPEEIDILKSPTQKRRRQKPLRRETVDVVDLHPAKQAQMETAEHYEAGDANELEIPDFEFPEDEPVIDIDFERKETLRAAMRRRVNRLRW